MPPTADTPPKHLKRHRRKARSTSTSQNKYNGTPDGVLSSQTKSDLSLPHHVKEATSDSPPIPSRPGPNPLSQGIPVDEMGKSKRTPRKNQGSRQNGSPSMPKVSSTPQPNYQTVSLTPGKKNGTPSQAYAGPTFHASPAASSLPMPRFFSKSVPEVNKDAGTLSATEKETTESSSEQSEGSPTLASARRKVEEPVREESPLDIFFRADKEQKERARERKARETHIGPFDPAFEADQPRHHSRHSTNGSMGALFPLELENQDSVKASHEKAFSGPTAGANDGSDLESPSTAQSVETAEQIEQRKAKTIALKKLLLSSVPPKSEFNSSVEQIDLSNHDISPGQKRASTSHIHKQIAAQTAQQMSPRPRPSSKLRKELSASALPDGGHIPELPATPTPSRTRNAYKSVPQEGRTESFFDPTSSPSAAPSSSKRVTPNLDAAGRSSPYKSMEDDLRRILKLNALSSDGAMGVRS